MKLSKSRDDIFITILSTPGQNHRTLNNLVNEEFAKATVVGRDSRGEHAYQVYVSDPTHGSKFLSVTLQGDPDRHPPHGQRGTSFPQIREAVGKKEPSGLTYYPHPEAQSL